MSSATERFREIYKKAMVPDVSKEVKQMEDYAKNNTDKQIAAMPPELLGKSFNSLSYGEAKALNSMLRDAETQAKINMDNRALAEAAKNKPVEKPQIPNLDAFEEEVVEVPANDQRSVLKGGNPNWRVDWDVADEAMRKAGFESQDVRKKASKNVSDNVGRESEVIVPDFRKINARKGSDRYGKVVNKGDQRTTSDKYDSMIKAKDVGQRIINNEIGFGDDLIYFMDYMSDMMPEETEAFRTKLWKEINRQNGYLKVSEGKDDVSLLAQTELRTPTQNARAEKLKDKWGKGAGVEKMEIVPRVDRLANGIANLNSDEQIMEMFRRIYGNGGRNIWTKRQLESKIKTVQGKKEILEKIAHAILIMSLSKGEGDTSVQIG